MLVNFDSTAKYYGYQRRKPIVITQLTVDVYTVVIQTNRQSDSQLVSQSAAPIYSALPFQNQVLLYEQLETSLVLNGCQLRHDIN